MALEPIELLQLWIATVLSLFGVGAFAWHVYRHLDRPRLRPRRSWAKIVTWKAVYPGEHTDFGIVVEYTGRQKAKNVEVLCELGDLAFYGTFLDGVPECVVDIHATTRVRLFSVIGNVFDVARGKVKIMGGHEPPINFDSIKNAAITVRIRSEEVEGSDFTIAAAEIVERAEGIDPFG